MDNSLLVSCYWHVYPFALLFQHVTKITENNTKYEVSTSMGQIDFHVEYPNLANQK